MTVTPLPVDPIKLFCPPSVPTNEGVAVGGANALGGDVVVVPVGATVAASTAGGMGIIFQPLTVTPLSARPIKLFCPPNVPWNVPVPVGVGAGVLPVGVVPLGGTDAAAFATFVGNDEAVGVGAPNAPLIIPEATAGSTTLVNVSVCPVPLEPWLPPLTTN